MDQNISAFLRPADQLLEYVKTATFGHVKQSYEVKQMYDGQKLPPQGLYPSMSRLGAPELDSSQLDTLHGTANHGEVVTSVLELPEFTEGTLLFGTSV